MAADLTKAKELQEFVRMTVVAWLWITGLMTIALGLGFAVACLGFIVVYGVLYLVHWFV